MRTGTHGSLSTSIGTALLLAMTVSATAAQGPPVDTPEPPQATRSVDALAARVDAQLHAVRTATNGKARRSAHEALLPLAEQLVALRPDPASWYPLLHAQLGTERFAEARTVAEAWIAHDPDDWEGHYHLGQALYLDERWDDARPVLERAFEQAPSDTARQAVGRAAGFVYEKLHRWDDALAVYARIGNHDSFDRARANQATHAEHQLHLELGCELPEYSAEEIAQLEAELRALEDPSGQ